MTKEKMGYESPSTNVLVVRVESSILNASLNGGSGFSESNADVEEGLPGIFW